MKISVDAINSLLVCKLCHGYFRECHTIPECMHSFCKPCLIEYFYNPNETIVQSIKKPPVIQAQCPTCQISLGKNPLLKVIYDRNIQAIVDKLLSSFTSVIDTNHEDRPLKKIRVDNNDNSNDNNNNNNDNNNNDNSSNSNHIDECKNDENNKILLRLLLHPDEKISGHLPPLKKSTFIMKKTTKVEKLCPEIVKRLQNGEHDEVNTDQNLSVRLYIDKNLVDSEDTIIHALQTFNKDPSSTEKIGEISSDVFTLYYGTV